METYLMEAFEKLKMDKDVKDHCKRVMHLSVAMAGKCIEESCLELVNIDNLEVAALYHDVGKMYIPKEILNKPGPLSDEEMSMMKLHVKYSGWHAASQGIPSSVIKIILHHHETCNGKGYPFAISDSQLSIEAKILRVADVYDALTSNRPYRPAHSQSDALDIILKNRDEYDMRIVGILLNILNAEKVDVERSA